MIRATVIVAILAAAAPAFAGSPFNELSEAQKRRIVVPDIKALTYCVARAVANDSDAVTSYRAGSFSSYIIRQLSRCPREFNALTDLYEETYGDAQAQTFIQGPYLADLPRAVLSVIRPQLDAKVAGLQADEQRVRDAEAAQDAEAHRKAEEDKLAALRAQAEQSAEETKIARERQERIDIESRTMTLLRDKFYECADQQLPGLVKSGENADVLANTAMTICSKPLDDAMTAAVAVIRAKDEPSTQGVSEDVLKVSLRSYVKDRVVADAVQAKAGVGMFAATSK